MKFSKFLKEFRYEDWYLSNFIPIEMMSELRVNNLHFAKLYCTVYSCGSLFVFLRLFPHSVEIVRIIIGLGLPYICATLF